MTETCSQTGINLEETDFGYTLSLISGKYKMIVMYWLNENKPVMRYNELKRRIGTISFKTLSNSQLFIADFGDRCNDWHRSVRLVTGDV